MSIYDKNYGIEIDTYTTTTNSSIGLDSGVYKWAIKDDNGVYKDDILADEGISNLRRSVDIRTGGGLSRQNKVDLTLLGGFYSTIQSTEPIEGRRFVVYEITWNGSSYDKTAVYTGAINTADLVGYYCRLNCYIEERTRDVAVSRNSTIIGEVTVDGDKTGEKDYFKTLGYKAVLFVESIAESTDYIVFTMIGATPSNVDNLQTIAQEVRAKLDEGANIYLECENGTYKIVTATYAGGGINKLSLQSTSSAEVYSPSSDEAASIYWSTEVYNNGLDGTVIVDSDGVDVEVDDTNANIIDYRGGKVVDAYDGFLWRKLEDGIDYDFELDTYDANTLVNGDDFFNSVYVKGASVVSGDVTFTDEDNIVDWTDSTAASVTFNNTAPEKVYAGIVLNAKGYKFGADQLRCVVDYTISGLYGTNGAIPKYVDVQVVSYIDGTKTGEAPTGTPEATGIFRFVLGTTTDIDRTYANTPNDYYTTPTDQKRYEFYNPTTEEVATTGTVVIDLTDFLLEVGGEKFYDGTRLFIAVGGASEDIAGTDLDLAIRQVNLLEGYDVGVDGLSNERVKVDNSATNGTLDLAYPDIIKRQNLYGIGSTPPADGWGTDTVETDGNGNDIDTDYIQPSVPAYELNGEVSKATTGAIKKELVRSVPASSHYARDGKETLFMIGDFPLVTEGTVTRDLIVGEPKITAYDIKDIKPALSFTFGQSKKRLQITNVEAATYSSSYVLDEVGITDGEKEALWNAGHALYAKYGTASDSTAKNYPLVNDADGAYRVASHLYANMGYIDSEVFPRVTMECTLKSTEHYDINSALTIDVPELDGRGVVSSVRDNVYGDGIDYVIEAIDTEEIIIADDILETGAQTDDVLETGSQSDDILETGAA